MRLVQVEQCVAVILFIVLVSRIARSRGAHGASHSRVSVESTGAQHSGCRQRIALESARRRAEHCCAGHRAIYPRGHPAEVGPTTRLRSAGCSATEHLSRTRASAVNASALTARLWLVEPVPIAANWASRSSARTPKIRSDRVRCHWVAAR